MSHPLLVSVVIPTYREAANLRFLLPEIFDSLREAHLSGEVIVVDDNSGDDVEQLCRGLSASYPIRLVVRTKERGLATAVIRGLNEAVGNVLVVMDGDGSHPPDAIPDLVRAVQSANCDLALGSRYADQGSVDPHWSPLRRLNSWAAGLLARGLTDASDAMSGFFAIRRDTLQRAGVLRPLGYKIGLELIVRCRCKQIVEIPIAFRDRRLGESKLSFKQQWLYLRHLSRLYWSRYVHGREISPSGNGTPLVSAGRRRNAA